MPVVKPVYVNRSFSDPVMAEMRDDGSHPLVRAAFDFDTRDYDPGIDCTAYIDDDGEVILTPTLTRQSDKDDCDINVMMARYEATGVEPRVNPRQPQWGDFSDVPSYQDALNIVRQADEDFMLLSAEVRDRFGNDPAQMLRFLEDEANRDEAVKLGLVMPPPAEPPPQKVEVVNPPSSDGDASREAVTAKPAKPA